MSAIAPSQGKTIAARPTPAWLLRIGWTVAAALTLAIAIAPDLFTLSEPKDALVLSRATFVGEDATITEVALPDAAHRPVRQSGNPPRYLIDFDLADTPKENLFLFIPSINRRVSLSLNGDSFLGLESTSVWTGPMVASPLMTQLPRAALIAGRNTIAVDVEYTNFIVPIYLSRIYVGGEASLAPAYRARSFLANDLKIMAVMSILLMAMGIIFAYFCRRHDRLFAWLAALMVLGLITSSYMIADFHPAFGSSLVLTACFVPAMGLLWIGAAVAIVEREPPKLLRTLAIGVTCAMLLLTPFDDWAVRIFMAAVSTATLIVALVTATLIVAWGAFLRGDDDARLMLSPYFLQAWFAIRDAYVAATAPAHGFDLLFPYSRPIFLLFIIFVLLRRMSANLEKLDQSNEILSARLAAQQVELAAFHQQERLEATRLTRARERQRLTHDLHDGLSGHLVSIIALSERSHDEVVEQAARDALSDLRLVIYSLDLEDRELPVALAHFRDRLVPQLKRLGVALDWSIADLPEVSGVTPGNALAVLRILQEAINNALKHGPARQIVLRGALSRDGMAQITIENDGSSFVETGGGHGLRNMRRRAGQLHGSLSIEARAQGARLTLLLPLELPMLEDEASA